MSETSSILCTNCLKESEYINAVKYCVDCNENMCKPCLRQHIKAHQSSAHKLIGRDEIPDWMRPPLNNNDANGEVTCDRHPENVINKLCQDYDLLCCDNCEDAAHSSCKKVVPLQEAIHYHEVKDTRVIQATQLQQLSSELQKEKKQCQQMQTNVRKATATSLAAVRTVKEKAIKLFEGLERKALDEISSECLDKDYILQNDMSSIDETLTLIDICLKQLDIGSDSNVQLIQQIQRSQRIQSDSKNLLNKIRTTDTTVSQEFVVNPNIDTFLGKLSSLGGFGLIKEQDMHLTQNEDIDIRLSTDLVECNIQSITSLSDNTLIMTDFENEKLKCLNSSFELDEEYWLQMCSSPFAVCSVGQHEVAVSLPSIKQIQYLSLGPDIVVNGYIQLDEYCRGLAYSHLYDELYVGCGGGSMPGEGLAQIKVYQKSELITTFKMSKNGKPICTYPVHLAVSSDGTLIYVADSLKGMITLDRQGTVLSTLTLHELEEAHSLCVDIHDNVIVCGHKSNNVVQIKESGQDYKVILGEDDGILHPTDVCYDVRSAMLLISNGSSDIVKRFCTK